MDEEQLDYDSGNEGLSNEEVSLPKATVTKMIQEMLPNDVVCAKETRDMLIDCCVEFVHLIASEANETCEKDSRKTVAPEHVVSALQNLGYESYLEQIQTSYEEFKSQNKDREKKGSVKLEKLGLTEEELLKEQEALFERARQKFLAQQQAPPSASTSTAATQDSASILHPDIKDNHSADDDNLRLSSGHIDDGIGLIKTE